MRQRRAEKAAEEGQPREKLRVRTRRRPQPQPQRDQEKSEGVAGASRGVSDMAPGCCLNGTRVRSRYGVLNFKELKSNNVQSSREFYYFSRFIPAISLNVRRAKCASGTASQKQISKRRTMSRLDRGGDKAIKAEIFNKKYI